MAYLLSTIISSFFPQYAFSTEGKKLSVNLFSSDEDDFGGDDFAEDDFGGDDFKGDEDEDEDWFPGDDENGDDDFGFGNDEDYNY